MIGSRSNSIPAPVRLAIFLWGGMYVVLDPFRAFNNADLYWQSQLGSYVLHWHRLPSALGAETFTATGAPWVPQEWFFGVLVALAAHFHLLVLFSIAIAIVPIAVLGSIYIRSRSCASAEAIAVVLLLAGCALTASFGIRAQVLGYGCFAAFLLCLRRRDRWVYAAVPVVVIWANVHASVLLAPAFLLVRMIGAIADGAWGALLERRDIHIFALTLAAVFCTPLGWHLPVYALGLATSPIRHFIAEWQPVSFGDLDFVLGGLLLAVFMVVGGWREALRNKQESLPIAVMFVAMLLARRNVPLFAIAAAPSAARALSALFPALSRLGDRIAKRERFGVAASAITMASCALIFALLQPRMPPRIPIDALAFLSANEGQRRLFCEDFSACSAALQYRSLRVFIDGRADPYPLPIWKSYIAVIRLEPQWHRILREYGVNAVVAPRGSAFAGALASSSSWVLAFHDAAFVAYVRTNRGSPQ